MDCKSARGIKLCTNVSLAGNIVQNTCTRTVRLEELRPCYCRLETTIAPSLVKTVSHSDDIFAIKLHLVAQYLFIIEIARNGC